MSHEEHEHEPMPEGEEQAPSGVRAMAIVRWSLVGLMALAAVGGWLHFAGVLGPERAEAGATFHCPMHPSVVMSHPGECPICGMDLVPIAEKAAADAGATTYTCPMHPELVTQDPDERCPDCGMKLVKVEAGESDVPGLVPVELDAERTQLIGMKTAKVTRTSLEPELRTVGYVTPNEDGLAMIHTRFSGWIEELPVSQTGQKVKKGQVLATVYSAELLTAQQELLNALKWSEGAAAARLSGSLESDARRRLELLGISREDVEEIARTGEPLRAIKIRSPVNGYVLQKGALQGLFVNPGTEIFTIADLSTVWVTADVYEHDVARVEVGQVARLELAAYPGRAFTGKLEFIYPTLNADTRTLRVRLAFKNPELKLRPGMYGDVFLALEPAEGLIIPREALVDTGQLQYVFVAQPGGRFAPRRVRVGARSAGKVQVLEGISEGEAVVTTANFLIDSESRLRAAIEGFGAKGAHEH